MNNNTKHIINHDYRPEDISASVWTTFCTQEQLLEIQQRQFATYYNLLQTWNKKHNITAITKPERVITDHFQDSLAIRRFLPLDNQIGICDIGSGGGFPGIPLKICYPTIPFVLIEVNQKKAQFLQTVIDALSLSNIMIHSQDWRTFLRKSDYSLDLFLARASLQPEELVRIFKSSCPYRNSTLIYWASQTWQPSLSITSFIRTQKSYIIEDKPRKLVFLAQ